MVKNLPAKAGDARDMGWIPGLGRSLGGENGNPLQYSSLVNPMDRGAWWAMAHGVTKSQTQLSTCARTHTHTHTHTCAHTHTHVCTQRHMCAHMHTHTCVHTCVCVHIHTRVHAHRDTRTRVCVHTCACTRIHTCAHTHTMFPVCNYLMQISYPPKDMRSILPFPDEDTEAQRPHMDLQGQG